MIMTGTGKPGAVALHVGDQPFAVLNDDAFKIEHDGVAYDIRRTGFFAPCYRLLRGDQHIATAEQVPFRAVYTVSQAGREWTLRATGYTGTTFNLFDGATCVGRIAPLKPWSYSATTIELPDALTPPAQLLLIWLVVRSWNN